MIDIMSKEQFLKYLNQSTSINQLFRLLGYKLKGGLNPKTFMRIENRYNVNIKQYIENNKIKYKNDLLKGNFICKNCGKEFTEKYSKTSSGEFCSRTCAAKYSALIKREETNKKQHDIMFGIKYVNGERINIKEEYYKNPKICPICGNIIPYEKKKFKTCSQECSKKLCSQTLKKKGVYSIGGYVPFSCRSHHGYYKGIYCDSTFELAYLIYCLDHNINIKRCEETFEYEYEGKIHTYHPDFIVNNELIEIKNYYRELNDIKLQAVNKSIKILYYDDLCDIFEYVSNTYNKKYNRHYNNFYELYDDYKPKYTYICDTCGKEFSKNRQVKTDKKFCSRVCCGKYNFKKGNNNV